MSKLLSDFQKTGGGSRPGWRLEQASARAEGVSIRILARRSGCHPPGVPDGDRRRPGRAGRRRSASCGRRAGQPGRVVPLQAGGGCWQPRHRLAGEGVAGPQSAQAARAASLHPVGSGASSKHQMPYERGEEPAGFDTDVLGGREDPDGRQLTQRSSARYRHWPFRCCSSPVTLAPPTRDTHPPPRRGAADLRRRIIRCSVRNVSSATMLGCGWRDLPGQSVVIGRGRR